MRRGCAYRKRGGGFGVGSPLVQQPANDWTFAAKVPINAQYSDCTFAQRPGQLFNTANPELAQTGMAGGRRKGTQRKRGGACPCMMRGGRRGSCMRGGGCGCMRGGKNRKTRRTHGGTYAVNVGQSVGGNGPIVAPVYSSVPCDGRAGTPNPLNPTFDNPDPRAPANLYSLTPNQTGGAADLGNAFDSSCYRAPGSNIPVYNATSAGFHFRPSTEAGSSLPDGITAFNEVVPHAARTGGGKRRKTTRRRNRH